MHPDYQAIISLGPAVLPFIFKELQNRSALWTYALKKILGHRPVPTGKRVSMRDLTAAWIEYGRTHGYL
jgi:hypothetical protein